MTEQTQPVARHREMASAIQDPWSHIHAYRTHGGRPSRSNLDHNSLVLTQKTDDYVTPHFKKRMGKGEIIMNPFDRTKVTIEDPVYTGLFRLDRSDGSAAFHCEGSFPASQFMYLYELPSGSWINPDFIAEKAVTQAHANLAASDLQSLVMLAEAKQTYNTVYSCLKGAKDLLIGAAKLRKKMLSGDTLNAATKRMIRRSGGSFKAINKASKKAGNAYLQYRYGLRPIYYELQALAKALKERPPRMTFTGRSEYSTVVEDYGDEDRYYGNYMTYVQRRQATQVITCLAKILVEPKSQSNLGNRLNPFGLDDFFQSGWELLPYSFVIDWFLNVGDVIASWEPITDYNILSSCVTVRDDRVQTIKQFDFRMGRYSDSYIDTCPDHLYVANQICDMPDVEYKKTTSRQYRVANPSKPVIPSLDINLDVAKLVDIIALVRQYRSGLS